MAIKKEDLQFATLYQLAGIIKDDWEGPKSESIDSALLILSMLDDADSRGAYVSKGALSALRLLEQVEGWQTDNSELIKQECGKRAREYELTHTS